ncbi:MAG: alpha-ketoglutarate-dependent dioxygenase AlkB [Xanthomonadaceae bacterium]|jgi:alkylated DNA repair dioxygenase AlkB|nr:alpha-ketoglutarate-dependent dioxygenase AlkB [Xanthomonadaceae bacterium]
MTWVPLPLPDTDLRWHPAWLPAAQADTLQRRLLAEIEWEVHRIHIFGRLVDSPRLSCWIGDPGTAYTYSGTRFEPHPWPPALRPLRKRLLAQTGVAFNSVLLNRYRDGADSIGWHSDDEPALGPQPIIASLSLGAVRRFRFKRRDDPAAQLTLELPHGSLLWMAGDTQRHYLHALPKTAKPIGERINLTFRRIMV